MLYKCLLTSLALMFFSNFKDKRFGEKNKMFSVDVWLTLSSRNIHCGKILRRKSGVLVWKAISMDQRRSLLSLVFYRSKGKNGSQMKVSMCSFSSCQRLLKRNPTAAPMQKQMLICAFSQEFPGGQPAGKWCLARGRGVGPPLPGQESGCLRRHVEHAGREGRRI